MTTFIGIILGMFGISIMQLILATAMPFIVTEIGGDALYSWVFSSYMLASLLTIPIFSKMADLFGKKRFYLLGMGFFAAGTFYGGFAPNMPNLIVARVIQGLGAGMMTPVSMAFISDLFPEEKRGRMIGAFSMVQLLANLVSPILGSVITKQWGWHWIFFITLGMLVIAFALVASDRKTIPPSQSIRWTEIDLLGGLLFGGFCVLTVNFSNSVSKLGQLELTGISLLIGAVTTGLLLTWNELRHKDPIIKLAFFQNKVLRRSIFSAMISGGIMYGLVTLLPVCNVVFKKQGAGAEESQLLMIFMVGATLGMIIASRLTSKLNAAFPKYVWGISVLGAGLLYYATNINHFVLFNVIAGLLGLCLGGIMATLLINSQNAVDSANRTVLSGLVQLGRYLGASVGVTILTGILPEVSQISAAGQFLGAFGLLIGMYVTGLANELV